MIWILTLGLSLAQIMIGFRVFQCFLKPRESRIRNYVLSYSFILAIIMSISRIWIEDSLLNLIISFISITTISVFFYASRAKIVLLSCGYLCAQVIIDSAVVMAINIILGHSRDFITIFPGDIIAVFENTIVVYVSYIIATFLYRTRKNVRRVYQNQLYYQLIMVPFLSIVIIFVVLSDQIGSDHMNYALVYTILTSLVIINLFQYTVFERLERLYGERIEQNSEIEKLQHREIYYNQLEQHQEEIRRIRHDMRNQLMSLDYALAGNDAEAIRKEIAGIITDIERADNICYTKNNGINTILNVKVQEMRKNEIESTIEVNCPQNLRIQNVDIGVVIGNLLDNAIEACGRCKREQRFIHFIAYYHKNILVISCKNAICGKVDVFTTSKKDKKNHGYGLKSIAIIARKYNGAVDYSSENGFFQVDVNLWDIEKENRLNVVK